MLNQNSPYKTEKEKRFAAYWDVQREKGMWKYSFKNGVLLWGMPVFAMQEIFRAFSGNNYTVEFDRIIFSAFVWALTGFLGFGLLMWWWNEKSYKQLKEKTPEL